MSSSATPPDDLNTLRDASDGLMMPSETDAPFEPFLWPDVAFADLTPQRVAQQADAAADAPVEVVSLRAFFRDATKSEEWNNAEEAAEVEKFKTKWSQSEVLARLARWAAVHVAASHTKETKKIFFAKSAGFSPICAASILNLIVSSLLARPFSLSESARKLNIAGVENALSRLRVFARCSVFYGKRRRSRC